MTTAYTSQKAAAAAAQSTSATATGNVSGATAPNNGAGAKGPKKDKGPSIELQWSRLAAKDTLRPWRVHAINETQAALQVYRWHECFLQPYGAEGGMTEVLKWLAKVNNGASYNNKKALSCYDTMMRHLRGLTSHTMPAEQTRAIVPLRDVYLEIHRDGRVTTMVPKPAYGMTYAINLRAYHAPGTTYTPQPLTETSRFRRWLERAQPNPEVRALIQEQCGATLLPYNYSQAAWWYGKAGSGKSTLAELCRLMQRQGVSTRLKDLAARFALEPLLGASLVHIDEVDIGEKYDEGLLKTLISQNSISVDRKHEKAITTQIRAKWLICSNDKPFIRDKSDGMWRRLCVVEWRHEIPEAERISNMHEVFFHEEGRAILDWMIEGAIRLVARGRSLAKAELPEDVQETMEYAREEGDSVRAWRRAYAVTAVTERDQFRPKTAIYQAYRDYCLLNEIPHLESNVFWRALRPALGLGNDRQLTVSGRVTPCQGVAWRGPQADEAEIAARANVVTLRTAPAPSAAPVHAPAPAPTPSSDGDLFSQLLDLGL